MTPPVQASNLPLAGVTVIDCGQLIAAGTIAMILGDFGADVIKVENPIGGDPLRNHGKRRGSTPLYWKFLSRNKRSISLSLSRPEGQALFRRLLDTLQPDVVIESFRPGTLERWGLSFDVLRDLVPGLILVRVSGFGQTGPYRERPGFGTLAEAMSSFAHTTGQPDGPPTLPPVALADSVAALYATIGILLALRAREASPERRGQVVDASLLESLFSIFGHQLIEFDQLGIVASRNGNRAPTSAPRNLYPTVDNRWIAVVAATPNVAERVFSAIGREDLIRDPRFATSESRVANVEDLDQIITSWTRERTRDEALAHLIAAEVPVAPVADMAELATDPHLLDRKAIVTVDDPDLGPLRMPGVLPRLSETPGTIRTAAPPQASSNDEIYFQALGLSEAEVRELRDAGVI